jgi:polynucleotide 5'-kinase involved in rRNA processing
MTKRVSTKNPFDTLRKTAKVKEKVKEIKEPVWISVQLTTLNSIITDTISLIKLGQNERLTIQGKCQVGCVVGAIEILGFELVSSENIQFYPVYSPSSHTLLSITPTKASLTKIAGNATDDEQRVISELLSRWKDTTDTVIALKRLDDQLQGIEKVMPIFKSLFGSGSTELDYISISLESNYTYFTKQQQVKVQEMIREDAIVCVVGNVNSGKSTTTRFIVNSFLNKYFFITRMQKVVYLDCDVGQPELSVPGLVSLHIIDQPLLGPPFTHFQTPYHSFHLGFTSPKVNPDDYLAALVDLVHIYRRDLSHLPLIVNTCGWTKGIGYDIQSHFVQVLEPTELIMMDQFEKTFSFPNLNNVQIHSFTAVQDQQLSRMKLNGADQRSLQLTSYFFQHHHHWDFSLSLCEKVPFRVSWSRFRIWFRGEEVPFSQALYALNGTLVGLAIDQHQYQPKQDLTFIPNDVTVAHNCVGLGLIRSIDPQSQCFYILTPIPAAVLEKVNLIIRGSIECPPALFTHGFGRAHVPYTTFMNAEGAGSVALKNRHLGRKKMQ